MTAARFTMFSSVVLLLLAGTAWADSGVICGHAFRDLVHLCGHPTLSTPASCCPAIRQYNDALCWCQPTGLALASSLATNQYAFALRAEACNVTTPFRPSFGSRDGPPTKDTCPKTFTSLPPDDSTEGCPNPAALRAQREKVLSKLDFLELTEVSSEAVKRFRAETKSIFVDGAAFASVGLSSGFGVDVATDLLLARQPILGAVAGWILPQARAESEGKFWRGGKVSYSLDFASPEGRFLTRSMFVGFEHCSKGILDVYAIEDGVIGALADQFYYPAEPADAVSMYDQTPVQICKQIADNCGALNPYDDTRDCERFMTELKKEKRVMCNRFDKPKVSVLALLGNTMSCRYSYVLAAKADPKKYCPLVGKSGEGLCSTSACSADEYEDIFSAANPRYESSSSFTCNLSTGKCVENWPRDDL